MEVVVDLSNEDVEIIGIVCVVVIKFDGESFVICLFEGNFSVELVLDVFVVLLLISFDVICDKFDVNLEERFGCK